MDIRYTTRFYVERLMKTVSPIHGYLIIGIFVVSIILILIGQAMAKKDTHTERLEMYIATQCK